jgi:hypothetical protein
VAQIGELLGPASDDDADTGPLGVGIVEDTGADKRAVDRPVGSGRGEDGEEASGFGHFSHLRLVSHQWAP